MSVQLVIFDIDGTLSDTKKVEDKCFMTAFHRAFGLDISQANWDDFPHVTDWAITETIISRAWERLPTAEEYKRIIALFEEELVSELEREPDQFKEIQGASAFFHHLQCQEAFQVGIATGSWSRSARIKLNAIGIDPTPVAFAHSDLHKSRADITRAAISQAQELTKQPFDQIVYFGDGSWDYRTCKELDIPFIGIDVKNDGKLSNLGAQHVFQHFSEQEAILELLDTLRSQ